MGERVVVLGAGYAGSVAVRTLERTLDEAELTWVADVDYHLVLHEVHRVIRDPAASETITVPVSAIKADVTAFRRGRVVDLDPALRRVELEGGDAIEYDYVLVALGSDTAFYGIPGLAERAHTLKRRDDAVAINAAVTSAADAADPAAPARVVVGGAGLSGVQAAGELAALRDGAGFPLDVTLVEALPDVMPRADPGLRRRVRRLLDDRDIAVLTDDPVTEAAPGALHFDEREPLAYDVLVWTGGITGRAAFAGSSLENDHGRLTADATFETSDDRVFAVGDAAVVGLDGDQAPPTAQAAWAGGSVAAENVVRAIDGRPLRCWTYRDRGTLVSVGDEALAHGVPFVPVETFGGSAATLVKKFVGARWIARISNWRRGLAAWDVL